VFSPGRAALDVTKDISLERSFDHIVHGAGLTGVRESWANPQEFIRVNVGATVNLLEYCRRSGCSMTFLSAYVYGPAVSGPVSEQVPAEPHNPYALSKRLAEIACEFFARTHGIPVTVLRLFNVYGPGQKEGFLVPTVLRALLDPATTVVEVENLRPRRDYVHVSDVASAVAATLGRPGYDLFNVGSGTSYSVADVIETAMKAAGIRKPYKDRAVVRRNELPDTVADTRALQRASGWMPSMTLEAGLTTTIGPLRE
jgi:nucleoside-diphosphate-sugar epimerase